MPAAKDKLTAEQKTEFKEAFDNFADGDGNIHNDKLKEIFKGLGQELSEDDITSMVMEVDEDGSGEIDIDEFYGMMADLLGLVDPEPNKDAFNCMQSAPGYISVADMKEVLAGISDFSAEEKEKILKELDTEGNGKATIHDFRKVFMF
jgi:Ca2+-binding EF-hand superfamily protein